MTHRFWLTLLVLGVWLTPWALAPVQAAPASIYAVTSTLDKPDINPGDDLCADNGGNCTLRAAVMEANAHAGIDTIQLPADTFHLTRAGADEDGADTGDLDLLSTLTIQGAGAGASIIDASGLKDRVIQVLTGTQASLNDLTIQGGIVPTSGIVFGGGLLNSGAVTLTRVIVTHNNLGPIYQRAGGGLANTNTGWLALNSSQVISNQADAGAVFNYGHMAIRDSQLLSNTAVWGGGIHNAGVLTLSNTQVLSNSADSGGAISNFAQLDVSGSLFAGNQANIAGGLWQVGSSLVRMTVAGSIIRDNEAAADGGGLYVRSGVVTVTASTLWHNSAVRRGGVVVDDTGSLTAVNTTIVGNAADESGGGVYQTAGSFAAYNVTIAGNFADADDLAGGVGGGLFRMGGLATLSNALLANNFNPAGIFYASDDCFGAFGTFHYSLVGVDDNCTFTNVHTLVAADPHLRPLAANGGPTPTMALGPGSAALDAGDPAGCARPGGGPLLTDQRGWSRHVDGNYDGLARCDMGAFEVLRALFLPVLRR